MNRYNFSGHPAQGFDIAPLVGANLSNVGKELQQQMREMLLQLPGRDALLAGAQAEVLLPGLAQAAAILLAEWHGQFGNWPHIRWAVKSEASFGYPDTATADLNAIRDSARTARGS